MGWWRNDEGDQLGDGPADAVTRHLRALSRPSLGALLRGLQDVLAHEAEDLCAPGDQPFRELVADVELVDGRVVIVSATATPDPRLRAAIDTACEAISDEYDVLERRPTRRELLRTFDFVLGYEPDQYLEIEEGASVQEIRAVE